MIVGVLTLMAATKPPIKTDDGEASASTTTGTIVIGNPLGTIGIGGRQIFIEGTGNYYTNISIATNFTGTLQIGTNFISGFAVKWETLTNTISEDNGFRWVPGGGPPIDWQNIGQYGIISTPAVAYLQKVPAPATERWTIKIVTRRATISGKLDGREWSTISDTQIWAVTNRMRLKQEWEAVK